MRGARIYNIRIALSDDLMAAVKAKAVADELVDADADNDIVLRDLLAQIVMTMVDNAEAFPVDLSSPDQN